MNLVEHVTETLGSVDSFSVAASAAAVAVGAVAAKCWGFLRQPQERVRYVLLGGGKAATELAARLPEAEVVSVRPFTGDGATVATMKAGLASIRASYGRQRCVMVLFAAEADPVRFQDSATQFAAKHGCPALADEEAYAFLAPAPGPGAPLNPMLRLNVLLPFALAELAAEDPSVVAVCVSTSYVYDPKVAVPAGSRFLEPGVGHVSEFSPLGRGLGRESPFRVALRREATQSMEAGKDAAGYPTLLGNRSLESGKRVKRDTFGLVSTQPKFHRLPQFAAALASGDFADLADSTQPWMFQPQPAVEAAALDDTGVCFEEQTKHMKHTQDMKDDNGSGGLQDTADDFLATLRKGLANGASFFPDHFRPKAKGGGGIGGYQLSKYLCELAFEWRRHFDGHADDRLVVLRYPTLVGAGPVESKFGGGKYYLQARKEVAEKTRGKTPTCREKARNMLTYRRAAEYTAQVLARLPDPEFRYVNVAGPYAFSDKDYHVAVRHGLCAGCEDGHSPTHRQLRVIRDQIRGLLDEDEEAEEAAALHAGCPSHTAAKDNTIIAVDPAHFTPADPREVVAEFYDAIADWTSAGMKGDLPG